MWLVIWIVVIVAVVVIWWRIIVLVLVIIVSCDRDIQIGARARVLANCDAGAAGVVAVYV